MILSLMIMLHVLTFARFLKFCKSPKTHHEEVTCNRVSRYFPANLQPCLIKLRLSLPKILAVSMKRISFFLFISTFLFFVAWKWIAYTAKHAKHFDIKTVGQKQWFFCWDAWNSQMLRFALEMITYEVWCNSETDLFCGRTMDPNTEPLQ